MKKTILAGTLALSMFLGGAVSTFAATPSPSAVAAKVDGAYAKLADINSRMTAFSAKLTAHGIDASSLNSALADVQAKHDAAYNALTTFKTAYNAAGDTYTAEVRADFVAAKDALKALKASIKNAHSVAKSLVPAK